MKTTNAFILFSFLLITLNNQVLAQQKNVNQVKPSATKVSRTEVTVSSLSNAGKPIYDAKRVLKDFPTFWDYHYKNVTLNEDFLAYDLAGKKISKTKFLNQLKTGKYIALQVYTATSSLAYKLHKIPATADPAIVGYMRDFGKKQLIFSQMKGKKAPAFNFTDVNGKTYTSENTKGKIVLFKCWFTTCTACIAEMPELNKLVKKYKNRTDILFISLAINDKKELQRFLSKTKFDYATIPAQESYMRKQLNVAAYPTHFLINKTGKIIFISEDADQIKRHLEKEIAL
ncbi:TlpA family protein disulfide reductase [Pedobacter gandavensis]|uniref:Redoxin domain-containing protein n=1 Tax=Pedobacter gandavensis TaxID=2679963 RepID=A0ABR6EU29_9SPHI|nr:TlpA disulfide reductase family protein [Pedobacter gandavensis]MBB2147928.1 redoxin domain-containing protein [Pedobacter gandavensis]